MQLQIKKTKLNKLIKFSKYILLSNNKIYFIRESLNGEILNKCIAFKINSDLNYLVFISKEIKKELDKLDKDIKITFNDCYLNFDNVNVKSEEGIVNNIEIELMKVVTKYDK